MHPLCPPPRSYYLGSLQWDNSHHNTYTWNVQNMLVTFGWILITFLFNRILSIPPFWILPWTQVKNHHHLATSTEKKLRKCFHHIPNLSQIKESPVQFSSHTWHQVPWPQCHWHFRPCMQQNVEFSFMRCPSFHKPWWLVMPYTQSS